MRQTVQTAGESAATIFTGSFLLFLVQPLLGRTLLPAFGGSAAVWGVCLAAYQVLLLAGYSYAHELSKRPISVQRGLHRALLLAAAVWSGLVAAFGGRALALFEIGRAHV